MNANREAYNTHVEGNLLRSIITLALTPQPKTVNQANLSQLPPTPRTSLTTNMESLYVGKRLLSENQHTPTCLPAAANPFKIDCGNMPTPTPPPTPISDSPTNAQVPCSEIEQEKKVTFHYPVPIANLGFTSPVTQSKGRKTYSTYHKLDSRYTSPPSGKAHPEDNAEYANCQAVPSI